MTGSFRITPQSAVFRCATSIVVLCLVYQITQVHHFTKHAASYKTAVRPTDGSSSNNNTKANATLAHPRKKFIRKSFSALLKKSVTKNSKKKNVTNNKAGGGVEEVKEKIVLIRPIFQKENFGKTGLEANLQGVQKISNLVNHDKSPYKVDASQIFKIARMVDGIIAFKMKHARYYNEPIEELPLQTKGIIILTQNRSGSTFLGEIFDKHPDVFYVFEPLGFFDFGQKRHKDKVKVVSRNLKCDFPDIPSLYKTLDLRHRDLKTHCIVDNFCFRNHMRNLCGQELCPFGGKNGCNDCGPVHLPRANYMCREKKMTVVKLVRLRDIMPFKTITEDPTYDLKIIHLVRDPRGIESSRVKLDKKLDVNKNSMLTCGSHLRNGIAGFANTTETQWLKDRYYRIRYEDLAMDPFKYTEEIYRFAGLEFKPEIGNWIKQNTQQSPATQNPWTTKRNSSSTMEAWRNHLPFKNVSIIQKNCANVLDMYGYKPVTNESELHDFRFRLFN